jgi:Ni/Co efflux regulator RcnB
MQRSLRLMFTVSLLAAGTAFADPSDHSGRHQQNGGARYDHSVGGGNRQAGRPAERAAPRSPAYTAHSQGPTEYRRPDMAAARGNERGAGWGGSRDARPDSRAPNREPARSGVYGSGAGQSRIANRPNNWNDRPGNDRGVSRDYARADSRYPRAGFTGDHRNGNEGYRNTSWNRDRNDWRDERGRTWHHDRDWYQQYRGAHFNFYGNRYYARQRFSIGFYVAPWGYSTRLWGYGDRLPLAYYGSRYLINDYYDYDLYAPPYATAWVRVGNDVMLIDLNSGEVLDVVADLFW